MNKKRKLRICCIGDIRSVHIQRWVNFLVNRGHEVHLIDDHPYKYKNLKFYYLKNYTGIRIIDYLIRLIRAPRIVRKIKPDVLHCQQVTYHGFLGALSSVHPFIITPLGSDILFDPEKSEMFRRIIKFVFDKADVIHHIDTSTIGRVKKIYGNTKEKNFVLNEGTNIKIFKRKKKVIKKKDKVTILCLRAFTKKYNVALFVEALNILVNKYGYKNILAYMCGTGEHPYLNNTKKCIKRYDLSKYIKFYKWIEHVTYAQKLMEDADIYIDTMYRPVKGQGTGKTALEAMSSELTMVMPDNPSMELYIKNMHNGIIYKKNNPRSLAKAIVKLVKNKKLRLRLGKNARKFIVTNLDWNKNMKIMEEKYHELAGKKLDKN